LKNKQAQNKNKQTTTTTTYRKNRQQKTKPGYQPTSKYATGSKKQKICRATKLNGTHQAIPPMIWLCEL